VTTRANIEEWKTRLEPGVWSAGVSGDLHIGSSYDVNFADGFKRLKPAVWILGQNSYAIGDESENGYTQIMRIRTRIELVLRLVVARGIQGTWNNEAEMKLLYDAVVDRLFNWVPTDAESSVFFVAAEDGDPNNTFVTVDLVVGYMVVKDG
jgi:hypothetical protein